MDKRTICITVVFEKSVNREWRTVFRRVFDKRFGSGAVSFIDDRHAKIVARDFDDYDFALDCLTLIDRVKETSAEII